MKYQIWRLTILAALLGVFIFVINTPLTTSAQEANNVFVTSPAEGETLAGLVTITGAIDFNDFTKYDIFLKTGDDLAWVATGYAPVINGNLARLDTRLFIDGIYQLVIRQVNSDSNYTDYIGPTITLTNGLGSPVDSPEIESSLLYSPVDGALLRVRNCGGSNLEFDYKSREGFCSAQDLWIMNKPDDHPFCPSMDVLLIPCPYEGSAIGQGEPVGATYSFEAEEGKIYEFTYAGNGRFFLGEVEGDERASTDTGGLPRVDDAPIPVSNKTQTSASPDSLLPVSGQSRASSLPFIGAAISLILFLIAGGVVALRKRTYTP